MSETPQILFNDGAAYERFMGIWSRLAGDVFLDWVAPAPGLRWADIGCGNGASTELLLDRCAPALVEGIDPSPDQLAYARDRLAGRPARFRQGSAMDLPYADGSFDAAVMALVLFFVPDPARGVAEMTRVVASGGTVAAYAWDMLGGGFPIAVIQDVMRESGLPVPLPPSVEASRRESMRALWSAAGLRDVALRPITVSRHFADFDTYWTTSVQGPALSAVMAGIPAAEAEALKERVRSRLPIDPAGGITATATANAVKGLKP
ncbi:methyltransferase domain-containing protein [Roseomonas eburnea]|uniref:Methyltransferase domain-containing protein n=1 Tax=Neoroseomonas eburnea TaxID=1346889 RepID=A0A9X9X5U3_9PROT|nr:class I SAM-dependent methyltransferase [Neoroseomonas eburnea]MBR0679079.1 methyltransferase domain-containing protein [Neoroseomonas eburnea]